MAKSKPKYNNSAGRLLHLFKDLKGGQSFYSQLTPRLLGVPPEGDTRSKSKLGMRCVIELHSMYADFLKDLENNPQMSDEEKAVFAKGLNSLSQVIFPLNVDQQLRPLTDSESALLEVLSTKFAQDPFIDDDGLEEIRTAISTLRDCVKESANNPVLREILLELIRIGEDSISKCEIHGAKELKSSFKKLLAELAETMFLDEDASNEVKKSKAWPVIIKYIKTFDDVASRTLKYKPLLEHVSAYLSLG